MACVTLKRPYAALSEHPFEPPNVSSPSSVHQPNVGPAVCNQRPPPSKRRRCVPLREHGRDRYEAMLRRQQNSLSPMMSSSSPSPSTSAASTSAAFRETPLSPAEIANNLRDELKRLRKRKLIAPLTAGERSSPPSSPEPMMDDASVMRAASAAMSASSAGGPATSTAASSSSSSAAASKPIFTLKQMTMIVERMCKERTDQVRAEYEKILQQKLGEQYDAFVRFIDHQIQQRFQTSALPSYLS